MNKKKKQNLSRTDKLEPFDPSQYTSLPPRPTVSTGDPAMPEESAVTDRIELSSLAAKAIRSDVIRKQACLILLNGIEVGRMIGVENKTVTLGRSPDCDEVILGEGVSRLHAQIEHGAGNLFTINDLGSTNGTYVQGKRIVSHVLKDGDKIVLGGRMILKFVFHDEIDETYFQEIFDSTTRDGLTGIFNRKYLEQKIYVDLSFARRHGIPFTLAIFDVDWFKRVNDDYGHQSGDQALIHVTNAVNEIVRAEDTVARYGGEEFAVVALGTDAEGGQILAERIRRRVAAEPVPLVEEPEKSFRVTISVGVATVQPRMEASLSSVIALADRNLYEAKRGGRNRVVASTIG